MRRHMYVRTVLGVMLVAVGLISLNPLFLLVGAVFLYSAFTIWKKDQDDRNGRGGEGRM